VAEAEAAHKAAELIRVATVVAAQKLRDGRERYRIGHVAESEAEATREAAELIRTAALLAVQKLRDQREGSRD
jgi:hypothetical protein